MKKYYDIKHKLIFFKINDYIHLRLYKDYQIIEI